MTDISEEAVPEGSWAPWARTAQGAFAVKCGWDAACQLGITGPDGRLLDMDEIAAIVHAGLLATADDEPEPMADEPAGCVHRWDILSAQEATPPGFTFGKPVPHTAVLTRCRNCGQPESWLLIGAWDLKDLQGNGGTDEQA
jgi:hypothetical protein